MDYKSVTLHDSITITNIYTIHYFEYMNDFRFLGERHDFWEFCCVDKGEVNVLSDTTPFTLKKGNVIFHKPNEFHNVEANGIIAPNLIVVAFECTNPIMNFFEDKIFTIDETERNCLANLIAEARNVFSSSLDDPYLKVMQKNEEIPFGSEQLIRHYLEYFLLHLHRRCSNAHAEENNFVRNIPTLSRERNNSEIFNRVIQYMEEHIASQLTIEQICKANMIGRSQLQKIFQKKTGLGIIEYFSKLKIDAAKYMIRSERLNFTQISSQLGYSSVHYFSRQFKKITHMTPSEYASSVKALSEHSKDSSRFT